MSLEKVKLKINDLKKQLRRADYRYYVLSDPEISDKEYDSLLVKLQKIEQEYPQFITPDSPSQRVSGMVQEGFSTHKYKVKMLSLDNTYSVDELKKWEAKIKRMLKKKVDIDYVVEPKIDGVSCTLIYQNGSLTIGATRGDGEKGEDVTFNIKTIKSLPLKLIGDFPETVEIRGEVYIEKKDFAKLNQERIKAKETAFANPRNAASGSLKLLDPCLVAKRRLRCLIHSFGQAQGVKFKTHNDFLKKVSAWGIPIDRISKRCKNLNQVIEYCLKQEKKRNDFAYEADGMVVKVNNLKLQEELGATLKSPRWAVAYKFPAHQATTKVKKIAFGVGRTGIITPVAILNPVECAGVTISRATLHNFDEIKRLDIGESDWILLERAGEVIPKIIKVITSKRTGKEKKVNIPSKCPACKEVVSKAREEEVYWYCLNPNCPAQLKRSLKHFASRGAMDIEGIGESAIDQLVDKGMVKALNDIYKLNQDDFLKLPLFKEKRAANLISSIAKSKKQPLGRFLYGLGIRHVGEKAAALLAREFKTIDRLFRVAKEELEAIPEIGPIMAESIVDFFSSNKIKTMFEQFRKAGLSLNVGASRRLAPTESKLSGKVFIFTGELESLSRSQAKAKIESLGAKWVSSISKNIDFVVVGKNPGSKLNQAKTLNLKTINEKSFLKLLD